MSVFDFAEHITSQMPSLTPGQLTVQPLSGGFTNITVRASFDPPVNFRSQKQLRTAVLKYAPPFIASDTTQPLSVHRQTIEARALNLLSGLDATNPEFSTLAAAFPDMVVPALIYHDEVWHVLWMSDLGKTKTLSEYLSSDPPPPKEEVERLAGRFGGFISEMFRLTGSAAEREVAANPPDKSELGKYLANMAKRIMEQENIPDADQLSTRVLNGVLEKIPEPCFGMVDFWPESVLINHEGKCGLVDWEYFGVTTAGSELGMLVAHLQTLLLNDQVAPQTQEVCKLFIKSFLGTCRISHSPPSLDFKHRFLVSHGRELVNGVDLYSNKLSDASKARLVRVGVRSLRAAGSASEEVDGSFIKDQDDAGGILDDLYAFLEL